MTKKTQKVIDQLVEIVNKIGSPVTLYMFMQHSCLSCHTVTNAINKDAGKRLRYYGTVHDPKCLGRVLKSLSVRTTAIVNTFRMKLLISVTIVAFLIWRTGQAPTLKTGFEQALTLSSVLDQALKIASK